MIIKKEMKLRTDTKKYRSEQAELFYQRWHDAEVSDERMEALYGKDFRDIAMMLKA